MAGRIVLFGATGYTGAIAAEALVRAPRTVIAGRSRERLEQLNESLGADFDIAVADVDRPLSVTGLVGAGDVLLTTVGPFLRWGKPALHAAIEGGAHYIDSTGEPPFIRNVHSRWSSRAVDAGVVLLTAHGYDYVPGCVAASLALQRAPEATAIDVGYFVTGGSRPSGGTMASLAGLGRQAQFAWRGGRLVSEASGARSRLFDVRGKERRALSIGGLEHLVLPRENPQLRDVGVYLGWFGGATLAVQAVQRVADAVPAVGRVLDAGTAQLKDRGSSGGPSAEERERSGSWIAAEARSAEGDVLASVVLSGVNAYTFTGRFLAWAAQRLRYPGPLASGALGPVGAFGLDAAVAGCAEAGLTEKG